METCPICLDSFNYPAITTLLCTHAFCSECIGRWWRMGRRSCPLCRSFVTRRPRVYYSENKEDEDEEETEVSHEEIDRILRIIVEIPPPDAPLIIILLGSPWRTEEE